MVGLQGFFPVLFYISQLFCYEHDSFFGKGNVFKNYKKNMFPHSKLHKGAVIRAAGHKFLILYSEETQQTKPTYSLYSQALTTHPVSISLGFCLGGQGLLVKGEKICLQYLICV